MTRKRKIIVWASEIDNIILEKGPPAGIIIQMMFWSNIFVKNNWKVYSFTKHRINNKKKIKNINFIYRKNIRYLNSGQCDC